MQTSRTKYEKPHAVLPIWGHIQYNLFRAGLRCRRFLGGVGFLTNLRVGVVFFVQFRMSSWIMFYITLLNWNSCWNCTICFKTFVETKISCCVSQFPLILTVNFHSFYVKESEILERSEPGVGNFGKVRARSRILCLRLRNPGFETSLHETLIYNYKRYFKLHQTTAQI